MDATRYKLYYFDARGRGELIRLLFHAAGEPFEDIRVHKGMWDQLKSGMPLGTLPVLEFEDQQLCQSLSIARYLADLFDLSGRNNVEKALVDCVADTIDEILSDALKVIYEPEKKYKDRHTKKFIGTTLPKKLGMLEAYKQHHSHGYGYVIGNDLTYADLFAYSVFDQIVSGGLTNWDFFEKYSYPSELHKRIMEGEPRISEYLKHRMD